MTKKFSGEARKRVDRQDYETTIQQELNDCVVRNEPVESFFEVYQNAGYDLPEDFMSCDIEEVRNYAKQFIDQLEKEISGELNITNPKTNLLKMK
jgi:hypothetical protein